MSGSTILKTQALTKHYGSVCALNALSLDIKREINGLVGPNGAGKSTFINIVTGMVKPDAGQVELLGKNPFKDDGIRKRIGILPEKANYHLTMTVEEYINHIQRIKGKIDHEVNKMLAFLDVPTKRSIGGLSAGMYQKFGLLLALLDEPDFVILDEPTANLDPVSRKNIQDLILDVHQDSDTAFLISTHILPELEAIASNLIIIDRGKLLTQGNPAKLRKKWRKSDEIKIMVDNPLKFKHVLKNDTNIEILSQFADTFRLRFRRKQKPKTNLKYLLDKIFSKDIEIIEIDVSSSLEEIFRRITQNG